MSPPRTRDWSWLRPIIGFILLALIGGGLLLYVAFTHYPNGAAYLITALVLGITGTYGAVVTAYWARKARRRSPTSESSIALLIVSVISLLGGIAVFLLSGSQGPLAIQWLSLVGSVMMVSGICFGRAAIILIRDYNKYERPRR